MSARILAPPGGPCMCGATDCPSCGPAQGYTPHEDAIEAVAEALLEQYLADPRRVGEAASSLTDAEYCAIDEAHAERDAAKLFAARDTAVRRVLCGWAINQARKDFALMEREDEDEAVEIAMED